MDAQKVRYNLIDAYYCGIKSHPTEVMAELNISYRKSEPQSIADCWIFYECKNLPNPLPKYLDIL